MTARLDDGMAMDCVYTRRIIWHMYLTVLHSSGRCLREECIGAFRLSNTFFDIAWSSLVGRK